MRYLAPPFAFIGTTLSIILGTFFAKIYFVPAGVYLLFLIAAALAIGKSARERSQLPVILFTMHVSWGAGFITSRRLLVPSS